MASNITPSAEERFTTERENSKGQFESADQNLFAFPFLS